MAAPTSLRWLARLPECGGKVGTLGTGYVGGTWHDPACLQPSQVACMAPADRVSGADFAGTRHGGPPSRGS